MAATKRSKRRPGRRRPSRPKAARKAARRKRPVRASARRRPAKKAARKPKKAARKATKVARRKTAGKRQARAGGKRHPQARPSARSAVRRDAPPSVLGRSRRQLPEDERTGPAEELVPDRMMQAARAGHDEMRIRLQRHTETSPELTAGDPDAKWEDAYAVGDEAPGGDNPTPDQDRVDDIGKALGIQYRDDQELRGGDEVKERDRRRWELDPASSEDWPHDKKKK